MRSSLLVLLPLLLGGCREYRGEYRRVNELPRVIWVLEEQLGSPCRIPDLDREVALYGPVARKGDVIVYAYRAYDGKGGDEAYDDRHLVAFEATGEMSRTAEGLWREYVRVPAHEAEAKIEAAR